METLVIRIISVFCVSILLSCSRTEEADLLRIRNDIEISEISQDHEINVTPITRNIRNIVVELGGNDYYVYRYKCRNKYATKFNTQKVIGLNKNAVLDTTIRNKIYNILSSLDKLKILSIKHCMADGITVYRTALTIQPSIWNKEKYVLVHFSNGDSIQKLDDLEKEYKCLPDFRGQYNMIDSSWIYYSSPMYGNYNKISDFLRWRLFAGD